jgi:serine protease
VEPALTPAEIAERLIATARPFPGFCGLCGAGIVDARAALTGQVAPPPEVVVLENGVPQTGLGGGPGTVYRYTLEVPAGAGNLRFALSGEQGDADLYVRYGSAPTQDQFDCRPYTGGSNETCEWETPQAGTWHVLVHAFGEFAGAALVGSHEMAESGYTRSPLSGGFFSWDRHAVEVPAGAQRLIVNLSGGRGNADLYLRHGSNPSLLRFDCASRGRGNDASCSVEAPQAGEWHIGLFSLPGYRDVTLQVRVIH